MHFCNSFFSLLSSISHLLIYSTVDEYLDFPNSFWLLQIRLQWIFTYIKNKNKNGVRCYSCWCSGAKSCLMLCDLMDCNTLGSSVFHYLVMLFSGQVMSDSLWPHGLQQNRLPWPSLSLGVCSNSYPLSWWCHPTISSSVTPFSSCPQSFPASGSFPMSWLFSSGGQSIGASALASVLPMDIRSCLSLGLNGLISLLSKELWRIFS